VSVALVSSLLIDWLITGKAIRTDWNVYVYSTKSAARGSLLRTAHGGDCLPKYYQPCVWVGLFAVLARSGWNRHTFNYAALQISMLIGTITCLCLFSYIRPTNDPVCSAASRCVILHFVDNPFTFTHLFVVFYWATCFGLFGHHQAQVHVLKLLHYSPCTNIHRCISMLSKLK
jgi:hypothetical protein